LKKRKEDINEVQHIEMLVASFYKRAMVDIDIGPFFTEAIQLSLEEHLPKITRFWSSILLDTNDYRDNPMIKHIALNDKMKISDAHMQKWLSLWKESIDHNYEGPKADLAKSRAEQIGILMLRKIRHSE